MRVIFSCLLTAVAAFGQLEDSPGGLLKEYEKLDLDSMAKMQRPSVEFDSTCKTRMESEHNKVRYENIFLLFEAIPTGCYLLPPPQQPPFFSSSLGCSSPTSSLSAHFWQQSGTK